MSAQNETKNVKEQDKSQQAEQPNEEHEDPKSVSSEGEQVENNQEAPEEDVSQEKDPQTDMSVHELVTKLKEAEQRADEHYQRYLRTQADLDNFRRRARQEKEAQAKYASLSLIEQLLPAIDNFERAISAGKETQDAESLSKGVEMVFKQVEQALQAEGLEVIPSVGEKFDPNVHQAVMQEDSDQYESGVVVEELQKGYKLKDKVIRPAMVKVST